MFRLPHWGGAAIETSGEAAFRRSKSAGRYLGELQWNCRRMPSAAMLFHKDQLLEPLPGAYRPLGPREGQTARQ